MPSLTCVQFGMKHHWL